MPPVGRAEQALRAQKDARQKKILIVLAPFLLALLAWQGPGMLKAFSGGDPPPPAPAQQSAATPTTPVDPTAGAAPSTATGEAAPVSGTPVPLPEGDEPVEPGAGQLVSFDRFVGKDPFSQQVEANTADEGGGAAPVDDGSTDGGGEGGSGGGSGGSSGSGSGGGGGGSGGGGADGGGGDGAGGGGYDGGTTPSLARLSVNGVAGDVSAGGTFPTSDPIFRLVSLSSSSVKIGLVSGEFSNGAETITVRQGKTVTLISQPDGFRYTIKLISLGQSF